MGFLRGGQSRRKVAKDYQLVTAAVLSGNRNYEARINPHVRANYLASPILVVAYALAGTNPDVIDTLKGIRRPVTGEALGVVETRTVAATVGV